MQINDIESAVCKILAEELDNASSNSATVTNDDGHRGIFTSADDAIAAAKATQEVYRDKSIAVQQQVVDVIKEGSRPYIGKMAKDIKGETGMGTVEVKIARLHNVSYNTPGPEILEPAVENGNGGMVMYERLPYGVIGAIGPSTNPPETAIADAIMMFTSGNTLYFGAHPGAKNITCWITEKMNDFIVDATGLHNLVVSIETPTVESVQQMMQHPDITMSAVTGGPAIAHQAMTSGKEAIGTGPGNPPAMVDATADIDLVAHNIITSALFDNDILRTVEREVVAESSIKDELIRKMQDEGVLVVNREQADKLADIYTQDNDTPDRKFAGEDAAYILNQANILYTGRPVETTYELPKGYPLVMTEMLMPILPVAFCPTFDDVLKTVVEVEQGDHHIATIHSNNLKHVNNVAHRMQCSVFVVNGLSYVGTGVADNGAHPGASALIIATPTGEGTHTARTFMRRIRLSSS